MNHGDAFSLLQREVGLQRQFAHSKNAVHRRADLVAHVGQKFALGAAGIFGGLLCGGEFLLDALAVRYVPRDSKGPHDPPRGIPEWQLGGRNPALVAIHPGFLFLLRHHELALENQIVLIVPGRLPVFGGEEVEVGLADQLGRIAAPEAGGVRPVDQCESAFYVLEVDVIRQIIH